MGETPSASKRKFNQSSATLLLAGAVVGIAWTLFLALMLLVTKASTESAFTQQEFGAAAGEVRGFMDLGYGIAAALYGISLIGGALVLMARTQLRSTMGSQGKSRAITGAILMLVTFNWVGGGLALAGALTVDRHA